jgi:hypothetical protein
MILERMQKISLTLILVSKTGMIQLEGKLALTLALSPGRGHNLSTGLGAITGQ